jgi:hypothetical protein
VKATSGAEAFDAEAVVLGFEEKPEHWGVNPLAMVIERIVTGREKPGGNVEAYFLERVRDELEVIETVMAAADEYGESYETDVSPQTLLRRLRVQCDAVVDLSERLRAARSEGGGFYGEMRKSRERQAEHAKGLDRIDPKSGSLKGRKPRKGVRRGSR